MPHRSLGPSHHQRYPAVVAAVWMMCLKIPIPYTPNVCLMLCAPELQPSGVEKTVVTSHPSTMPCYNCARPSPSRSLNTDGA
ncbi:hypothetical protein A2U01_0079876, partial [Trifolium medium]|nr:hypothetical protein [Trifolium medium]